MANSVQRKLVKFSCKVFFIVCYSNSYTCKREEFIPMLSLYIFYLIIAGFPSYHGRPESKVEQRS